MLFATPLNILGDSCIKRVVSATQYIDKPIFYRGGHLLTQLPSCTVFTMDKLFRIGTVGGFHRLCVPDEFLASAVGDIAKMVRFGQPARILKITGRWITRFASVNPFGVMPLRIGNSFFRAGIVYEFIRWQ
jgi:hypothetical protein